MPRFIQEMGPLGLLNVIILAFIIVFALKNVYLLYIKKPKEDVK